MAINWYKEKVTGNILDPWCDLHPHKCIGPHTNAILVYWGQLPLHLPMWVPFFIGPSGLSLSSLSLVDLDLVSSWNLQPRSIVFAVAFTGCPSVSDDRASVVFFHEGNTTHHLFHFNSQVLLLLSLQLVPCIAHAIVMYNIGLQALSMEREGRRTQKILYAFYLQRNIQIQCI